MTLTVGVPAWDMTLRPVGHNYYETGVLVVTHGTCDNGERISQDICTRAVTTLQMLAQQYVMLATVVLQQASTHALTGADCTRSLPIT